MKEDLASVNRAFSMQSDQYDEYDASNGILTWMRKRVRGHVLAQLKPGDRILELNAGTGLDALFFVQQGYTVYATDLSDGMVKQIQQKITEKNLSPKLSVKQCSYTQLQTLQSEKFDYVFSNFGGLNCIPDLRAVTQQLPALLNPGARITFVIMPPVCFWEIGKVFKGKWKEAFRRFKKKGSMAHLEGEYFPTFYFSPADVLRAFGNDYKKISLEGLATFSPPPHADRFPMKHPRMYRLLTKLDEQLASIPPFRSWADHFILTVQYSPVQNK
ncbi:MAG: SAM-dependent methyltransferase [Chitinophagaceae bacterium]|nr:SAM-dependent methyltransferase [Chitinophagaceae bacterium]